jgi:phosphoribosylformylglycinamidine synthase
MAKKSFDPKAHGKLNEWRVEVAVRGEFTDPVGRRVLGDIADLGIASVREVRAASVYLITGAISAAQLQRIASRLLCDPVSEEFSFRGPVASPRKGRFAVVQVFRKPGVMDPVEASTKKGIADMGFSAASVRTGRKFLLYGKPSQDELRLVADKVLHNAAIEEVFFGDAAIPHAPVAPVYRFERQEIALLGVSDARLLQISKERVLSLNIAEMRAIQGYFAEIGRNPTDVELESLAQTWSEHCVHKTFRGIIDFGGRRIDNLLKTTIMRATAELKRPWCVSVFKDNAGVIRFDELNNICFKVETHNHPSAIEPYGGAGTGIGGVIRDPLGTGLGAKPILNTDVFCFGPPDLPANKVPPGALHPKRVMKGVVAGVRDYGNRMGIPTANGAVLFDERYVGNPLVYCGNLGLIPRDKCRKAARPGDWILVVGGRTGRDGIHGATFSSIELTEESETVSSGAVQIGNAIEEKRMTDTILQARDRGLYTCITDCGAGGLSSAVGEMGEELGAEVHLDRVPLKYQGLSYSEIWISEAQERMVLAVPPRKRAAILKVFRDEDVEATIIGRFTDDRRLKLFYRGQPVGDLKMEFLHHGVPRLTRRATWQRQQFIEPTLPERKDYGSALECILGSWNLCSKEWIIRQYDHEVQGASVLKPLVGVANDGPGDAAVIAPVLGSRRGVAVSNGINPKYGDIDPYAMAASAIDEAVRQIISVGGTLDRIALLDNFCWGNTDKPQQLGSLVRAAEACYDLAKAYGTPFISGKDSLNNEFRVGDESISIPPTLLISAVGILRDVRKVVSMDAKKAGDILYVVGMTYDEMGGSHYYALENYTGNHAPIVRPEQGRAAFEALSRAIASGLVRACHDCSEGGIAVAAAEMAFAGGLGMDLYTLTVPRPPEIARDDVILFSESNSRFLCEVAPEKIAAFEAALQGVPIAPLGRVTDENIFRVSGVTGDTIIEKNIAELKEAWQKPLRW